MKITNINTQNIYFGKNNKNRQLRNFIPSKKSALLGSALLASSLLYGQEKQIQPEEELRYPITVTEANEYRLKHPIPYEEEPFSWDNIPDYKKITWLFYTMVAALFLMNISSGGSSSKSENIDNE